MSFTGNEVHNISFEDAAKLTKLYRDQMNEEDRKGGFFGRKAILALLDQKGCVGIRYYYGLDENDKQVLVIVGADSDENDLIGEDYLAMEMSIPCPNHCGEENILNH